MSKRVQLLGHIAEIANQFVGFVRELTVDTSAAELRLHDGVTEGGRRFLDRDANDNRYQGRSVELDGLLGWEPQERGFTVRLGPSNYRLRSITVNGQNLTVENANGYDGNPLIGLAPAVESDHVWTGTQEFTQEITASGGVLGNLVGDTTGTHTGDVDGNVTGNLTGNADGDHTGTFTGSADFSNGGVLFADEQLLLEWLDPAIVQAWTLAGLPVGSIVAYGRPLETVPANWSLCDGTNGTPDLRNRFIVAAGSSFPVDSTGGAVAHTHLVGIAAGGAHVHSGTVGDHVLTVAQIPSHKHANGVTDSGAGLVYSRGTTPAAITTANSIDDNGNDGTLEGWTSDVGSGQAHNHSLEITSGGAHAHSGEASDSFHIPPYYALIYIMKVA